MEKTNELKKRLEKKLGGWVIILPVDAPLDRVIVQYGDKQVNYIGKIIGNDDLIRVVRSECSLAFKEGETAERKRLQECWKKYRREGEGINTFLDKLWKELERIDSLK